MCVTLDFENRLAKDAPVDSGAYVSAIAEIELERIKQQAPPPPKSFKIDDAPKFLFQVAIDLL